MKHHNKRAKKTKLPHGMDGIELVRLLYGEPNRSKDNGRNEQEPAGADKPATERDRGAKPLT